MDKLSNKLKLVRSQSMGVGMGGGGDKMPLNLRPRPNHNTMNGLEQGRQASIVLLDERRLEMHIQPRLYAGELLDLVASHIQLKEKEYFGLAVVDDNGGYTWLQLDRKILDHDLPRKPGTLQIHFLVKFFIESICHLAENKTIELFYLQARGLIFRGSLEVEADIVFQLAALSLQASYADHVDEVTTRSLIRKSPILPANVMKDHMSTASCEDQVIAHYVKTRGQTRGQAIVNYMTIVESMPTYGVHYFEVLDKRGSLWWLGLSCRGIAQYEANDRKTPVRVFQWKQLENLYFRDKKFSIEVHDAKRVVQTLSSFNLYEDVNRNDKDLAEAISESTTQVSLSRRSYNPGNIHVYVWFGKTQALTKCIWQSAISQHQFYLDRKQAKMRPFQLRTLKEIARDLTRSSLSLSSNSSSCSMSNLSQSLSESTHSLALTASKVSLKPGSASTTTTGSTNNTSTEKTEEQLEEAKRLKVEMLAALKARREALDAKLKEKNALLKELCIKEGELTGELPPEIPLSPGEPVPTIRKRVGTEFKLSEDLLKRDTKDQSLRASLELELEIQNKITAAAHKLASDTRADKSVRKKRKSSYQQSLKRLQELEAKVNNLKHHQQQQKRSKQPREVMMQPPASTAPPPASSSGSSNSRLINPKRVVSVPEDLHHNIDEAEEAAADDEVDKAMSPARSCPSSPRKNVTNNPTNTNPPPADTVSLQNSPQRRGYIQSSVYNKSTYRSKQFPTFAAHNSPAGIDANVGLPLSPPVAKTASPYRNKYEVPNLQMDSPVGLYNCPQQRTSQAFSSMDDLDVMTSKVTSSASPMARKTSANTSVMMNHKYVLGQAREVMARVEAATASMLSDTDNQGNAAATPTGILVSATGSGGGGGGTTIATGNGNAKRELPSLPSKTSSTSDVSRSMENLHNLESALHGRAKMHYREIKPEISHNLHNTEEYPPHHTHQNTRDSYPLPPSHRTTSTTLLPGQTYPEVQPAKPITSLQDVFYHKFVESGGGKASAGEGNSASNGGSGNQTDSPPPPPLYPKKYHDVVEQRRRSGLDRPTAVAVPAVVQPVEGTTVKVPLESPAVDRRSKPKLDDSFELQPLPTVGFEPTTSGLPAQMNNSDQSQQQQHPPSAFKYVPYIGETTKPFEMSDFYKYSTKYKKASKNGSESSSTSTISNDNNNTKPPELPAKNSPAKGGSAPPPPPPPPKKATNSMNNGDLGETFSSEMLQWYKNQQRTSTTSTNSAPNSSANNSTAPKKSDSDSDKPATLV